MSAVIGDPAPDFSLPGTTGDKATRRDYSLKEYLGRPVVVVFYPGDNTPVCTRQLTEYTNDIGEFAEVDAQILAISPQSGESHEGSRASRAASRSRSSRTRRRRWGRRT